MIFAHLQTTLVVLALGAGWLAAGWPLTAPLRRFLLPSEQLSLALLLGGGLLGVVQFTFGQLVFSPVTAGAAAALAFLPLAYPQQRHSLIAALGALRWPSVWVLLPIAGVVGLLFVAGLAPTTGNMGDDGISYHLLGPIVWLRNQRIEPALDMACTAFPAAIEVLFAAGMALSNERAPALIGVLFAVVLIVQANGLARWFGAGARWAPLASLAVICMPMPMDNTIKAFVDVPYAAFALAAVRVLLAGEPGQRVSLLGGVFLGLCMSTKYNGITLTIATLAVVMAQQLRPLGTRAALAAAARACAVSLVICAPFYLRNWLMLGSPIYPPPPFLARFFPVKAFSMQDSINLARYIFVERGRGLGAGLWDFLLLPWRFTYQTSFFHGAGGIGLLPLAFFPAALLPPRPQFFPWLALWALSQVGIWFVTQQEARFLVPVVVVAAALAARGVETLVVTFPRWGRLGLAGALVLSVGYGAAALARVVSGRVTTALSPRATAERLSREVPFWEGFRYLNALSPPCRVLILSAAVPPYYLRQDYIKIRGLYDEEPVDGVRDATEALARLRELGVTHVMDVVWRAEPFSVPPMPSLELQFHSPTVRIYRVLPRTD